MIQVKGFVDRLVPSTSGHEKQSKNKIKYFETFNLLKHIVHDSKYTLHQF